jgi:ribosomal protein S15P/S13E
MSYSWRGDLALSATHLCDIGLTVAVIFGCNDQQMKNIMHRLQNSGDAVSHPLLIAGIFAELERERLLNRVEGLVDQFLLRTESLCNETRSWRQILNCQGEKTSDLLQLYNDSRNLVKGLGAVKAQLSKMIDHIQELESFRGQNSHDEKSENRMLKAERQRRRRIKKIGGRIRERLLEISEEYNRKIDDCKMVMEDLTVTTQMVCMPYIVYWHLCQDE